MAIYIGGTTQTYEFDFFTKVANSTIECPMKIYGQDVDLASLPNPSTGWAENTTQYDLDMLKSQDTIALTKSTTTSGKARAMMIEVDLSNICTVVYGSSNAAMKSNFKNTSSVDIYAIGSGANAGATAYKCQSYAWNATTSAWELLGENTNSTITLTNRVLSKSDYINSSNKLYLLIVSGYNSNGTIASSISLDYVKFKLNFNRTADIVSPIPINLTNKWSFLIKNVAVGNIDAWSDIISINKDTQPLDSSSIIGIEYNSIINKFFIYGTNISNYSNNLASKSSSKYKIVSFLLTNNAIYELYNNGTFKKSTFLFTPYVGLAYLYIGHRYETYLALINSFIDSIHYLPNYVPANDAEAEAILRGNKAGFENAELLYSSDFSDPSKWTLANGATISNKTLTLPNWNSTASQDVLVFPNNQYEVNIQKQSKNGVVEVQEYYNNIYLRSNILGAGLNKFTTLPYTNKTKILLKNELEGFSRSSIAYKSDGTQVAVNQPRLETGAFGGSDKAIMIEEGTTNLFPSAKALNFDSAWTSGTLNGTYTVSIKAGTGQLTLSGGATGTVTVGNSLTFTVKNATVTFTPSGGTPQRCQLEQKPYATSFVDGTRANEVFKMPNILNLQEGTVEIWLKRLNTSTSEQQIFDGRQNLGGFNLRTVNNSISFITGNGISEKPCPSSTLSWDTNTLYHLAVTWSQSGRFKKVYRNGVLVAQDLNWIEGVLEGSNNIVICSHTSGSGTFTLNSSIHDLRISNIARSNAEIARAYASNAPLPIDQYTTYKMTFDSEGGAIINNVSMKLKM